MPKAKSKAQARFFGAVAGGQAKRKGLSPAEARKRLRGVHVKRLPPRAGKRSK